LRSNPGDATAILSLAETPPHSDPLPRTRGEGAELFFPCRFVARLTRSHLCAQPDRRLFDRSFATAGAATPCWQQAVDMTACCHERLEAIRAYRSGAGGLPPQWPHHRLRRRAGRQDRPDQRTLAGFGRHRAAGGTCSRCPHCRRHGTDAAVGTADRRCLGGGRVNRIPAQPASPAREARGAHCKG
jgi:hypothetical protein